MAFCPLMTKDYTKDLVPCLDGCAWKVNDFCAISIIAHTQRRQYLEKNKKDSDQDKKQ